VVDFGKLLNDPNHWKEKEIMSTATASPFAKKADDTESGNYEQPPPGLHPCVLVGLIDLGTQKSDMMNDRGEYPELRKFFYVWELTKKFDNSGQNFLVGNSYTDSMHKKSGQRALVEGWLGRTFKDGEEFDPASLIGQKGLCNLVSGFTKKGKAIVKLDGINPIIEGLVIDDASHPAILFHISQLKSKDQAIPIPDWVPRDFGIKLIDKIRKSPEWLALPDDIPF
jgi:hypothetical protein